MSVLTELRNRGIQDAFIVCCDGLKGLPDAIRATWPQADVQLCVVHLVRSSLRFASKRFWGPICRDMREIYTAPTVEAAEARFAEFADTWAERYPAMIDTWRRSWAEFVPFLDSRSSCARSCTPPTRAGQRRDQTADQRRGNLSERCQRPATDHRRGRRDPRRVASRRTPLPLRGVHGEALRHNTEPQPALEPPVPITA
jgi:hypothetical protein